MMILDCNLKRNHVDLFSLCLCLEQINKLLTRKALRNFSSAHE